MKATQNDGAIRAALERTGRPTGVNDLHIAAHVRSQGLTLVTNNLAEFERVPGLLAENQEGVNVMFYAASLVARIRASASQTQATGAQSERS